jgi:hypothetical protein
MQAGLTSKIKNLVEKKKIRKDYLLEDLCFKSKFAIKLNIFKEEAAYGKRDKSLQFRIYTNNAND